MKNFQSSYVNPLKHLAPLFPSVLLDILQQIWSGYLSSWSSAFLPASGEEAPSLKTSGVGHLVFLVLCWKFCDRFQVVTFLADLAQFSWVYFGGLGRSPTTLNVWHWSFFIRGIMLDILQQVISDYLSSWSSSILGVQFNNPHDHIHQLWHGRLPVPGAGSHTRCGISRNWLPFQLT